MTPHPLIPHTGFEADRILGARREMRLDTRTMLVRSRGERDIRVVYSYRVQNRHLFRVPGTLYPVRYWPDGRVTVACRALGPAEFSRIVPALPHGWTGTWRPGRRPHITYRGVWSMALPASLTFHPIGDIEYSGGDRTSLAELNAMADEREHTRPMRSRRRNPRPLPSYLVRTYVAADTRVRDWQPEDVILYEYPGPTPDEVPDPTRVEAQERANATGNPMTFIPSLQWRAWLAGERPDRTATLATETVYPEPPTPAEPDDADLPLGMRNGPPCERSGHNTCLCGECHVCQANGEV